MNRRARIAALLVLALGAFGLVVLPSSPATAADGDSSLVSVSGRVVDGAGHPVEGAWVGLDRDGASLAVFSQLLACGLVGLFSLGLLFLSPDVQKACTPPVYPRPVRTGPHGRFTIKIPAASPFADGRKLKVDVSWKKSVFHGRLGRSQSHLPTITLMTNPLTFTKQGDVVRVKTHVPHGAKLPHSLDLDARPHSTRAWIVGLDKRGRGSIDSRVLEDALLKSSVHAEGRWNKHAASWQSPSTKLPKGKQAPESRGQACYVYTTSGDLVELPGCPMTDGRLGLGVNIHDYWNFQDEVDACKWHSDTCESDTLVIDLGEVRSPDAVVLRDSQGSSVELSLDGQNWHRWSGADQMYAGYNVVSGDFDPARYIRIHGTAFTLWHLTEVSLWTSPLVDGAAAAALAAVPSGAPQPLPDPTLPAAPELFGSLPLLGGPAR